MIEVYSSRAASRGQGVIVIEQRPDSEMDRVSMSHQRKRQISGSAPQTACWLRMSWTRMKGWKEVFLSWPRGGVQISRQSDPGSGSRPCL